MGQRLYTDYSLEINDKYVTYLTFSNSRLKRISETVLETGYSFDTVFNNLTGDMVSLVLLNAKNESSYRLYEFLPNSDVITNTDYYLKTLEYDSSNVTVFLNGKLLNNNQVNYIDSSMIKIIPTVNQGDIVHVFCGDTSYLKKYVYTGKQIIGGADDYGNVLSYNKEQIIIFLNGNIIPIKDIKFGAAGSGGISFIDDIVIGPTDIVTVLTFNNEFTYFEYYPVSGQRDFNELDYYGNRPSYSPVSSAASATLKKDTWNLINGVTTGYRIIGVNGGSAIITDSVLSKPTVNISITEPFPNQANYENATYSNINDINGQIFFNLDGYVKINIPVTTDYYIEIYNKFVYTDTTDYNSYVFGTDGKFIDVYRDLTDRHLHIYNETLGSIDTGYEIANNTGYLIQIINYNNNLNILVSNNDGNSWDSIYTNNNFNTTEDFDLYFGNTSDYQNTFMGFMDFNYTYIKNRVLSTYWLGTDNVLSSQNWYLRPPTAKDITDYLTDRTKTSKLIPEVLKTFQAECLDDIHDSIARLERSRNINTMDFDLMLKTLDMLGMYLNSSQWSVTSRRKALLELNSFYRRVGTKESINFVGYVEDNIFRILSQLWTNDYIHFLTEADFPGAVTRKVFIPDMKDYGSVLSNPNITEDYGYVTDDAVYIDYGLVRDPTSGEWVEYIDFTPPEGWYPTNRVLLEYTVNSGETEEILGNGPDVINKFYELVSAVLVLHDIVGDILFDQATSYIMGTFYEDVNISLTSEPQIL